jgi:membrane protein implicated in regulation of membrane protease activity
VALTIAIVLALIFLPWPWNLVMILGGLVIELGELAWGLRLARRWKPRTGAEAMIGMEATVVSACRPDGEVRVHGELWRARCEEGADAGDTVRIERLDGLTLVVTPASRTPRP